MPFEKGKSGNPSGRKKGSENIDTLKIREKIRTWTLDKMDMYLEKIEGLDTIDFVKSYEKVLEYSIGKIQRKETQIDLSNMTDEEAKVITDIIVKKLNNGKEV